MTGDGPILGAYGANTKGSVDSTTWITIVLVVVILLLIYRSPISPLIPLFTITIAYLISRGVVAFLGAHALTISMYTNVFLIVVLFGAGTDYCLFLISRFREEMAGASTSGPAVKTTVRAVGATIASSAGTVIVGLAMMTAAELGLYNTSGPSLAISVALTLLAGLTLTPAILAVLGHYSFWPRRARPLRETGVWHAWACKVVNRPWWRSWYPRWYSSRSPSTAAAWPGTSTCSATSPKITRPARASISWPSIWEPARCSP
jgi:RND superfamily putative drug exporter